MTFLTILCNVSDISDKVKVPKSAVVLTLIHFVHLVLKDGLNDFQFVQLFHEVVTMHLAPIPLEQPFTVKIEIQAPMLYAHMSYSIPRALWESLDAVLFSKGLTLAKEIAKDLGVPSQPLVQALNTQERGKFTILPDDEASTYQCQALVQHGATYMRCRCPSLKTPPGYCNAHEKYNPDIPKNLKKVRRIDGSDVPYLLSDTDVYTLNGKKCGYLKGSTITLFEIET